MKESQQKKAFHFAAEGDMLTKAQKFSAFLVAAAGVIMFSAKAVFVKKAYVYEIDSVSLLLIRMGIALPVYVVIAIIVSIKNRKVQVSWKDYFSITVLGIMGYYLASLFDFEGLNYLTASLERLILFVYPTLVLLISALVLKKKIHTNQKLAIIVTYVGVLVAFYKYNSGESVNVLVGAGLIFASALSYAVYLVGSGTIIPRLGSVRYTAYVMIVSCVAVIVHFFTKGNVALFNYPTEVYKIGIGMAIFSTILPSFLIGEAIKQIGASNVAIVGSIGPVSTIVLAAIFLGERISVFQLIGTAIVIAGVLLITLNKKKVKA